ncbi:hypothetical protein E5Q_04337 [Mixia osmundae IAM 14324]|uniref:Uncharacterized protein n=1 Tax=Mixia osmundae (strain CBS 9802 / IAM 14324 / JCM 22182 / KY 12970) TaxID=764103 RepID=G7E499_MIXOS|nr:hypothetical protein E5Q_04337 [Mixia osmundae IAM 14324]
MAYRNNLYCWHQTHAQCIADKNCGWDANVGCLPI